MSESELLGRGYPPSGYFTLYCGYLPPPCIPGYMDTGYSCIADTMYCGYQHPHGIRNTGYSIHVNLPATAAAGTNDRKAAPLDCNRSSGCVSPAPLGARAVLGDRRDGGTGMVRESPAQDKN